MVDWGRPAAELSRRLILCTFSFSELREQGPGSLCRIYTGQSDGKSVDFVEQSIQAIKKHDGAGCCMGTGVRYRVIKNGHLVPITHDHEAYRYIITVREIGCFVRSIDQASDRKDFGNL